MCLTTDRTGREAGRGTDESRGRDQRVSKGLLRDDDGSLPPSVRLSVVGLHLSVSLHTELHTGRPLCALCVFRHYGKQKETILQRLSQPCCVFTEEVLFMISRSNVTDWNIRLTVKEIT